MRSSKHEKYKVQHIFSTQRYFVISDILTVKVVTMIAGFKWVLMNIVTKFSNKKSLIGSIYNAVPSFGKTIKFIFAK